MNNNQQPNYQTGHQQQGQQQQYQQSNKPLDKGRACVVVERYQTNQLGDNNQPMVKNRYATIGRATLWPNKQGSNMPNIEVEIDTMPIGVTGSQKVYIFWDSEQQQG